MFKYVEIFKVINVLHLMKKKVHKENDETSSFPNFYHIST